MSDFKFSCPHCGQHLQGDEAYRGQGIQCPKCRQNFTVPRGSHAAGTHAQATAAAPRAAAAATPAEPPPPPVSKPGRKPAAWIATVLILAVVATAAGYLLTQQPWKSSGSAASPAPTPDVPPQPAAQSDPQPRPGGSSPEPAVAASKPAAENQESDVGAEFRYLPPDAEMILQIRLAELWSSPLVQRLMRMSQSDPSQQAGQMKQQWGFSPAEVETITLAAPDLAQAMSEGMSQMQGIQGMRGMPASPPGPASGKPVGAAGPSLSLGSGSSSPELMVLQTKNSTDPLRDKLLEIAQFSEPVEYDGKRYYRFVLKEAPEQTNAVYFAGDRIAVGGTEAEVRVAMDRESTPPAPRRELETFDFRDTVVLALLPSEKSLEKLRSSGQFPVSKANDDPLLRALDEHGTGYGFSLKLTDTVALRLQALCGSEAGSRQVLDAANDWLTQIRIQFDQLKNSIPPPFNQLADEALAGLQAQSQGTTVRIAGQIPPAFFSEQNLGMLPMLLFSAAMSSGQYGPNPMGGGMPPGMSPGGSLTPGQPVKSQTQSGSKPDPDSPTAEAYEPGLFKRLTLSYVIPFGIQPPAQSNPLVATLELQGQRAADASAYGKIQFESVTDDTGKQLEFIQGAGAIKNPTRDFISVDRRMMFAGQLYPPEDKVRIHMMFQHPDSQATRLGRMIGSLQLIARGDPQTITVEKPLQKTGQSIEDPALASADLQIQIHDRIETISTPVSKKVLFLKVTGPAERLVDFRLLQDQDQPLALSQSRYKIGNSTVLELNTEERFSGDTRLQLAVLAEQKTNQVNFAFQSVPLPKATAISNAAR